MEQSTGIPILFCDDFLLVINKPPGISTLPDGYDPSLPHIKSLLEQEYGRLWIVHRLDKETSGILLLARSSEAHRSLNSQFENRLVRKIYHALVRGVPEWHEKIIDLPLRPNGDRQHRTVVDFQAGKLAITQFKRLEKFDHYCLLEAVPKTGRTHQIRAHLAAIGLFIIGDRLYRQRPGQRPENEDLPASPAQDKLADLMDGMALHAVSLDFNHPLTGERMSFEAPYPGGMFALLNYLRSEISPGL